MIVFSSYPGDVRVRREAEALVRRGMKIDIICLGARSEPSKEEIDGVSVYRIHLKRTRSKKLRYIFEYGWFILASLVKLTWLHFFKRYRFIHVHNLPDVLVFSAIVPRVLGAKVILDLHDLLPEFYTWKYKLRQDHMMVSALRLAERASCAFAHHVVVSSPFKREKILERSAGPEKCTTILNLPDPHHFGNGCGSSPKSDGKFKIIYAGTLSELHGVDHAIKAVGIVASTTRIPVELRIFGGGTERDRLGDLVNELGLSKFVFFHKPEPVEVYSTLLRTMDVGIVPKRGGVFGDMAMSTKLMEFAYAGLPSLVSRTKSDSWLFDDSMVFFFEPGNENQIAEGIIKLYQEPKYRESLAVNARRLFDRTNWETESEKLCQVYDGLCKGCLGVSE
jgi:glycosyltransferase involved in cell wall biosynthesis